MGKPVDFPNFTYASGGDLTVGAPVDELLELVSCEEEKDEKRQSVERNQQTVQICLGSDVHTSKSWARFNFSSVDPFLLVGLLISPCLQQYPLRLTRETTGHRGMYWRLGKSFEIQQDFGEVGCPGPVLNCFAMFCFNLWLEESKAIHTWVAFQLDWLKYLRIFNWFGNEYHKSSLSPAGDRWAVQRPTSWRWAISRSLSWKKKETEEKSENAFANVFAFAIRRWLGFLGSSRGDLWSPWGELRLKGAEAAKRRSGEGGSVLDDWKVISSERRDLEDLKVNLQACSKGSFMDLMQEQVRGKVQVQEFRRHPSCLFRCFHKIHVWLSKPSSMSSAREMKSTRRPPRASKTIEA